MKINLVKAKSKILIKQNNILIPIIDSKTQKYLSYLTWNTVFGKKKSIDIIKNCCLVVMAGGKGKRLMPFTEVLQNLLFQFKVSLLLII